jgi:hypothetical protein
VIFYSKIVQLRFTLFFVYDMAYELLKLVLFLTVATASVEHAFSAMVYVKTMLRVDDCQMKMI